MVFKSITNLAYIFRNRISYKWLRPRTYIIDICQIPLFLRRLSLSRYWFLSINIIGAIALHEYCIAAYKISYMVF